MKATIKLGLAAALCAACLGAAATRAAQLPQKHEYQKALRDYIATLTEADFEVELKDVTYLPEYFQQVDTVGRYWMLFLDRQAEIPPDVGICLAPKYFTLKSIEAQDGIKMSGGRGAFVDPKNMAWWTVWDYPGNPYYESKPVRRRAFVAAAVDMIMEDEHGSRRSDFLGGCMIRWGYCYRVTKDSVPESARKAFAEGLTRLFDQLDRQTPRGSGGSDMEFFQLVGMWYAADALGGDFPRRALKRAHLVIDRVTSKTGYELHGGAFDVSYQGIALRFLTWAATLYDDPNVDEALRKMLVLKSHLSLPEPDGKLLGPTHFNTGTAASAPADQWAWPSRDAAMAMIHDEALYTVWARIGVPGEEALRARVKQRIERLGGGKPSEKAPSAWKHHHWVNTLNFAFDDYQTGFYARLVKLDGEDSSLTLPPFARNECFIRDLNGGGEFLAARFKDYGVVIHTGAIATKWANGVSGKSGGSLSAFWTPQRGSAILGLCRATQSKTPDEWNDKGGRGPYTWGVHAITGRGKKGHYFSTARIRKIASRYEIKGTDRALVTVSGDLAASPWADPEDELKGEIPYSREFHLDASGLRVTSSLGGALDGQVAELWEMLPVLVGGEISFRVDGEWQKASEMLVKADRVRLSRYDAAVSVVLDAPRPVKLSPDSGPRRDGGLPVRNVMIDLLGSEKAHQITYRILPGQ